MRLPIELVVLSQSRDYRSANSINFLNQEGLNTRNDDANSSQIISSQGGMVVPPGDSMNTIMPEQSSSSTSSSSPKGRKPHLGSKSIGNSSLEQYVEQNLRRVQAKGKEGKDDTQDSKGLKLSEADNAIIDSVVRDFVGLIEQNKISPRTLDGNVFGENLPREDVLDLICRGMLQNDERGSNDRGSNDRGSSNMENGNE